MIVFNNSRISQVTQSTRNRQVSFLTFILVQGTSISAVLWHLPFLDTSITPHCLD